MQSGVAVAVAVTVVVAVSMRGDIPSSRTGANTDSFQEPELNDGVSLLSGTVQELSEAICNLFIICALPPSAWAGR